MAGRSSAQLAERANNKVIAVLVRAGVPLKGTELLIVPGRTSGKLYATTVTLVTEGEERWLVAPFGKADWVKNARAAGRAVPLRPPAFSEHPGDPVEAFEGEAHKHPVFQVITTR